MRRDWLAVGGLLVVIQSALFAAVFMPAPHTGGDNAAYLALGYALTQGMGYVELWDPALLPHAKYPPVYPALLGGLMLLGASSWASFKLLSAVLVSLAGLLAFVWAAGRRGPLFGGAVALLTVLSAGWLEASRWILSEPAFLCFLLLTLWAGDRAGLGSPTPGAEGADRETSSGPGLDGRWALVAVGAALLAVLTRTAGLPVVVALVAAFAVAGSFRWAAVAGGLAAGVGGAWALRARGGEGAYESEFWMVNPYDPDLGTVGLGGLLGRVFSNLQAYVGRVLPGEWWSGTEAVLPLIGISLVVAALAGWAVRLRERRIGVAELVLPLYAGLILVWPEVWAGDRFVLPLYPLLLFYAGEAVLRGGARAGAWASAPAGALAFLLLAFPAVPGALDLAEDARTCRRAAVEDAFRCYGPGVREFRTAAAWSGAHLPAGAVTLTRKPRIFYALGGTPSRTFPFTRDPEVLLAEADRIGARYLLVDHWDGVSLAYLPALVQGRPGAFCWLAEWGEGTHLLGILPPESGRRGELGLCPDDYRAAEVAEPRIHGTRVPLLAGSGVRREAAPPQGSPARTPSAIP